MAGKVNKTAVKAGAVEPKEARFYTVADDGVVECTLCPRFCKIAPGERGSCQARRNDGGKLIAATYGHPAALQVDPIEKKPLAWYMPGSKTFSFGTYGCNMRCAFCQNDHLSRNVAEGEGRKVPYMEPSEIVGLAREYGCQTISFTYNEPTIFIEYAMDVAKLARAAGLGTVLVTNGFINPGPRSELYSLMDAANIDVKGFANEFYRSLCGATLAPVLESCRYFKNVVGGHLEITNLLIPNRNDSRVMLEDLLNWIKKELGDDTPVHFTAYHPTEWFREPPTPAKTVYMAEGMARAMGFSRVHTGNIR